MGSDESYVTKINSPLLSLSFFPLRSRLVELPYGATSASGSLELRNLRYPLCKRSSGILGSIPLCWREIHSFPRGQSYKTLQRPRGRAQKYSLTSFFVYTFIYFSLFGSAPLCSGGRREDPGGGRRSSHARPGRVAAPGGGRLKSSSADGGSASLREDGAGSRPHFPGHSTRTTGEGFSEAVLLISEFCGRV